MMARFLRLVALGAAFLATAAAGETAERARSSEIRLLMIRNVDLNGNAVHLTMNDGVTLALPAADLKIIDERAGARITARTPARGTTTKLERARQLQVAALSELGESAGSSSRDHRCPDPR